MDDSDIDLFLSETNALDNFFYAEPPLPCFHNETMINPTESASSIPPPKPSSHMETFSSINNQIPPFITSPSPQPSQPSMIDLGLDNGIDLGLSDPFEMISDSFSTNPAPPPSYYQSLLVDPNAQLPTYFTIQNILSNHHEQLPSVYSPTQTPPINLDTQPRDFLAQNYFPIDSTSYHLQMNTNQWQYQFPRELEYRPITSNFSNSTGDLLNHDREAISSFLAGVVRPGPDVAQIYKCKECSVEFPNAQAFGGHMSSHSKNKRAENPVVAKGGNYKKSKLNSTKASTSNHSRCKEKKVKSRKRESCVRKKCEESMNNESVVRKGNGETSKGSN